MCDHAITCFRDDVCSGLWAIPKCLHIIFIAVILAQVKLDLICRKLNQIYLFFFGFILYFCGFWSLSWPWRLMKYWILGIGFLFYLWLVWVMKSWPHAESSLLGWMLWRHFSLLFVVLYTPLVLFLCYQDHQCFPFSSFSFLSMYQPLIWLLSFCGFMETVTFFKHLAVRTSDKMFNE